MVAGQQLRLVDVMERNDVKKALDEQLQVVREENAELKEAFGRITELAELLVCERENNTVLQRRLAGMYVGSANEGRGVVSAGLVAIVVIIASALMIAGAVR
jgi:hypothetical protein